MSETREKAVKMLALGSWHVYNRQTFDESVAFVEGALERGVNHFDIADYWESDFKNTERFRDVMKALGRPREDYKIGLKIFTNSKMTRVEEVSKFLDLLDLDYADYVLCSRPYQGETMEHAVVAMDEIAKSGVTRELDFSLWDAPQMKEAFDLMKAMGLTLPKFVQFQYNICRRGVVESEAYEDLMNSTGLKLQAAVPFEGGMLGGHLMRRRFDPGDKEKGHGYHDEDRNLCRDAGNIRDQIIAIFPRLKATAESVHLTPAQLSMAYVATNPHLENILFGATKLWQIDEAIGAVEFALENPEKVRELSEGFNIGGEAPKLFDFSFSTNKKK